MTTPAEAIDIIRKALKQNEEGELAKEIRLLRAEVARLTIEVQGLKTQPQVVPWAVPYTPPMLPQPVYPRVPTFPRVHRIIHSTSTQVVPGECGKDIPALGDAIILTIS